MAEDWLVDVRKYVADADEKVVAGIVRYCGIALRNVDSSLVSFSDKKETDRVRQNFLKKKLGLTDDDATLDAAIAAVGSRMKADRTKNRVTVYYLLAEHFDMLGTFGGAARGAGAGAAAVASVAAAAPLAAMSTPVAPAAVGAAAAPATAAPVAAAASSATANTHGRARSNGDDDGDNIFGTGCLAATVVIGAIIAAALLAWFFNYMGAKEPEAAPAAAVSAPATPATAPAPAPVIPDGAGVTANTRDEKPMLTVYFDTGKADVTPDFTAAAAPILAYLEANPTATLAISGFNDPTGNAAANAELSKNRAQSVKAALESLGVAAERAALEKPAETTGTGETNTESRRVEVVVKG